MGAWSYRNPVAVHFGAGALAEVRHLVGDGPCVLVTFPEARAVGLEPRLRAILGDTVEHVIDDVAPNPDVEWMRDRHAASWSRHPDATLVAVGGGSVLDTAKILAVDAPGGFEALVHALVANRAPAIARSRRIIAVPTTAGTGSEVTPWATLWDARAGRKLSLHCEACWPEHALVDPELTASLPAHVTRNSALDALSHALESIWNRNANPVSDRLAIDAAQSIVATLPRLLERPHDPALRAAASRAALMAGLAFSNTKTALAHSISYEMTLRHGLPHGLACSFTLPLVWRMATGHDADRDAVLERIFGADEHAPAERLKRFLHSVGVKTDFAAYGVSDDEAQALIEHAAAGVRGRNFTGDISRGLFPVLP
jgi:phosphonate metabolism-associated iron-containing alcohol dehydrogenase